MPKRRRKRTTDDQPDHPVADTSDIDFDSIQSNTSLVSPPIDQAVTKWDGKYIEIAGTVDGWGTADDVFDKILSLRTVFPDFNRATRVGGLPLRRLHTVHGATHAGKSLFVLGLVKSFVDVGFLGGYIDAEFALSKEFADEIVGDIKIKKNFLAMRPTNYEETIKGVDVFLSKAAEVREKYPKTGSILVVDSINKLVPKRELSKILTAGQINANGADELAKAHHARYRAALNQAWLDHLTPRLCKANCALVIVAQEREDQDTTDFFQKEFKVKGGAALLFDASLVMRVMKSSPIFIKPGDNKTNENICGFGHRVRIWKSKVAHMDGRYTDCIFTLSNGRFSPEGLDLARDAILVALKLGVVTQAGAWYSFRGEKYNGINNFVMLLNKNQIFLNELLVDVNAEITKQLGG